MITNMKKTSIGFVGGGRATRIILGAWKKWPAAPERITVSDIHENTLARLKYEFPHIEEAHNNNAAAATQDIVILSLHPPTFAAVHAEIRAHLNPAAIVISLAPRVTLADLSRTLGTDRVARMIPNAPSIINAGYNPVAFRNNLTAETREQIISLLRPLGASPEVDEKKLEAYAILTGMGPAYFWFQWYELITLGESFGLTREEAANGVVAMAGGASKTITDSGLSPEEVMDLIPLRPLAEDEETFRQIFRNRLQGIFSRLSG